jgi:sterol desaturase/sphingolipid hydroxylase (fatty acid hydroxylase superfamily)
VGEWGDLCAQLFRGDASSLALALSAIALFTLLELWRPAEPSQGWRGRGRNLVYLVCFEGFGIAALAVWYLVEPFPALRVRSPDLLAGVALLFANLFAIDFLYYWYHRAQHRFRFLWAIHELHHADAQLNATTSFRTYWLELPVQAVVIGTPTALLFGYLGREHALAVAVASYGFLIFTHCNIRLSLGPLSSVVCGPQVHRIHHSILGEHQDRNFAQFFPLIDRAFGSYHAPAPGEFPPSGALGLASDAPIGRALLQPFVIWAAELGSKRARATLTAGVVRSPVAAGKTRGGRRRKPSRRRGNGA